MKPRNSEPKYLKRKHNYSHNHKGKYNADTTDFNTPKSMASAMNTLQKIKEVASNEATFQEETYKLKS